MSRINTFHMWADMKSSINVVEEIFFIIQISLFCVKRRQALVTSWHLSFRIYMEQDMLSLSSIGDHMKITHEASDSSSSIHSVSAVKRVKVDHTVASTKFKGVVKQSNGNWGAQIYANHERIWLGTFKSEKEAAMAYDRAGMKLRSGDFQRNFPWTEATTSVQEQKFQIQFTTEQVLSMIKDGTYQAKFDEFLSTTKSQNVDKEFDVCQGLIFRKQLFRKALTPSDVGKLNRLVIPKKYALKYFQCLPESVEDNSDGDIEEEFFDNEMNLWKFRYCYWKSSQSFVFTKGWNRFVKEKKLKANDTIIFYACQYLKEAKATKKFTMIRVNRGEENAKLLEEDPKQCHDDEMSLKLRLEVSNTINNDDKLGDKKMEAATTSNSFKLFGVQIIVPQQREMNLDLNLL